MPEANVSGWVIRLSRDQADFDTYDRHYDDATVEKAALLIDVTTGTVSANATSVSYPASAIGIAGLFWDGHYINEARLHELEALSADWRDHTGRPRAWVVEDELDKSFRLYPVPDVSGTLTTLFHEIRTDLPEWADFATSLDVLSREFGHFSAHREPALAERWRVLAQRAGMLLV